MDSKGHTDSSLLFIWLQVASQVGALDIGYRPGLKSEDLKSANLLYLLAAVSSCSTLRAELCRVVGQ